MPSSTIPGVPSPWPGDATPLSTGASHLTPVKLSSQKSLGMACLQVIFKMQPYVKSLLYL